MKVDYATWFGGYVEFIHCIQMLPFTPISEELLRQKWIQEEYPVIAMFPPIIVHINTWTVRHCKGLMCDGGT